MGPRVTTTSFIKHITAVQELFGPPGALRCPRQESTVCFLTMKSALENKSSDRRDYIRRSFKVTSTQVSLDVMPQTVRVYIHISSTRAYILAYKYFVQL